MYFFYRCKGTIKSHSDSKIPKTIHLCWFSDDPYPTLILRCLHTWYRRLPDYKIVIWDRENALSLKIPYIDEALCAKKYAFAADVVRLYALYNYGGIYLDSDIYIKRRFDKYLNHDVVFFREYYPERVAEEALITDLKLEDKWGSEIQAAFFASIKGAPILNEMLDFYRTHHFISVGGASQGNLVSPQVFVRTLEKHGLSLDDVEQILPNDIVVYANGLVAGNSNCDTKDSFAIHCCAQSWKN